MYYVCDAMKRHKNLFGLLLLFVGLLTSCEEHEVLQVVEEQEVLLKDYQAAMDAMRAKKPQRTNDQTQQAESYGEKGHDRRDYMDWELSNIAITPIIPLHIGYLYVVSHNHDEGECSLRFFWGMSDYTSDFLRMINNRPLKIDFYEKGRHKTADSIYTLSSQVFQRDDTFVIPSDVCERTDVVGFHSTIWNGDPMVWTQSFITTEYSTYMKP